MSTLITLWSTGLLCLAYNEKSWREQIRRNGLFLFCFILFCFVLFLFLFLFLIIRISFIRAFMLGCFISLKLLFFFSERSTTAVDSRFKCEFYPF